MYTPNSIIRRLGFIVVILLLGACAAPADSALPVSPRPVESIPPTLPSAPTLEPSETLSAKTAAVTSTVSPISVCSPFLGYDASELLAAVSNPFHPPPPGSDDPHQAIDLAVVQSGIALAGEPVQAALAGRVALIVQDRFPYGNAILIETPLSALPLGPQAAGSLPTPAPTLPPHPALTCPTLEPALETASGERSLYLLYAHLEAVEPFAVDEPVECGQYLGRVGQSGNALNPHLHLEARVGPAGARFAGMAHYESRAWPAEMAAYCLWRVSGVFQLVDPWIVLAELP